MTASMLRSCRMTRSQRTGNHTERGVESLPRSVQIYIEHVHHHLKFVTRKAKKLGKK